MGVMPLSPTDIKSWNELSGTGLRSDEFDVLLAMDQEYLETHHEVTKAEQKRKEAARPPPPPKRRGR